MSGEKSDGVSPVIGIILLVAITVVLVAIIGTVVMSFTDAEGGKKVGMNAQPDNINNAKAKVILYGGESLSELLKLEMIDQGSSQGVYVEVWNLDNDGELIVGLPYTTKKNVAKPSESMSEYDTWINVKGTFTDGREVILLVQPMTFYEVNNNPFVIQMDVYGLLSAGSWTNGINLTILEGDVSTLEYIYVTFIEPGKPERGERPTYKINGDDANYVMSNPQLDTLYGLRFAYKTTTTKPSSFSAEIVLIVKGKLRGGAEMELYRMPANLIPNS